MSYGYGLGVYWEDYNDPEDPDDFEELTEDELAELEAEHAWENQRAETAYHEFLKEERDCYQLRQIGVVCNNCENKRFSVDLSIPF
jgi:hypothetical protein